MYSVIITQLCWNICTYGLSRLHLSELQKRDQASFVVNVLWSQTIMMCLIAEAERVSAATDYHKEQAWDHTMFMEIQADMNDMDCYDWPAIVASALLFHQRRQRSHKPHM